MPYNSISYEKAKYDILDYANVSVIQPGFGMWATVLKKNNTVIGWTCLKRLHDTNEIEIGYRYFPEYWNKGYCTEICKEILRYGFDELELNEIIAIIRPDNFGSIRVAEKLKLYFEKHVSYFGMDLNQYTITREKYLALDEQDVYGSVLFDYYIGNADKMENSWISSSKYYLSTYDEWCLREQKAMEYARGKVLDIGCAAGRHSLYLQSKGFDVTGIDNSAKSIEVCKLRGLKSTKVMDLEDLSVDIGMFDTIMMLGNNFGLVGKYERAIEVLKLLDDMTGKDSMLLLGSCALNMNKLTPTFEEQVDINRKLNRYYGEVTYHLSYKAIKSSVAWLWIEKDDLLDLIEETNFYIETVIEDCEFGEPYPYVLILRKSNQKDE